MSLEKKDLTFHPGRDSIVAINILQFKIAGLWPVENFPLSYVNTGWFLFNQISLVFVEIFDLYHSWGDFNRITLNICTMTSILAGLFKIFKFRFNKERFYSIVNTIDAMMAEQSSIGDSVISQMLQEARGRTIFATKFTIIYGVSSCVTWTLFTVLFESTETNKQFPVVAWYGFETTESPWYELVCTLQFTNTLYCFLTSWGLDVFFACILYQVAIQLRVLNHRLANIRLVNDAQGSKGRAIMRAATVSEDADKSWQATDAAHEKMYGELCNCIRHHQEIIRYMQNMEDILNLIVLTQFMAGIIVICVNLFQTTSRLENIGAFLKFVIYLLELISQIFIYCWCAHGIVEEGERVADSAYHCDWTDAAPRFKRALHIVMLRALRPITITAGKLYPIDRSTFVAIINASYSYYAVLRQVNDG